MNAPLSKIGLIPGQGRERSSMEAFWPLRTMRLLLAAALLLPFAVSAAAQSGDDIAKVISLMNADGYNFNATNSKSVWVIHFAGSHLKDIRAGVTISPQPAATLVVFVTVAEKRRLPVTTDFMRLLLEQDEKMDRVKIGFDSEGDLTVRIDARLRVTDAAEFKSIVDQAKNASDELYGMIEPQLTP
jgi:hypothetical protein